MTFKQDHFADRHCELQVFINIEEAKNIAQANLPIESIRAVVGRELVSTIYAEYMLLREKGMFVDVKVFIE